MCFLCGITIGVGGNGWIQIDLCGGVDVQILLAISFNEHGGFFLFHFREWPSNMSLLDVSELSVGEVLEFFLNHDLISLLLLF